MKRTLSTIVHTTCTSSGLQGLSIILSPVKIKSLSKQKRIFRRLWKRGNNRFLSSEISKSLKSFYSLDSVKTKGKCFSRLKCKYISAHRNRFSRIWTKMQNPRFSRRQINRQGKSWKLKKINSSHPHKHPKNHYQHNNNLCHNKRNLAKCNTSFTWSYWHR